MDKFIKLTGIDATMNQSAAPPLSKGQYTT
jgi:hypothetical protein